MANRKEYETYIAIGGKVNSSLRNATNSACKQLSGIKNAMNSVVGATAGFLAIDNIKNFTLQMVDNAASLESYRNTLNVVMKDQKKAAKIMSWAVDFANVTPFDTNEVVEASVRLQAYGINAQKTMTNIGNMASVMNKPLMQAVEAVADAQTGELERLKEFGITKTMIVKKANQLYRNANVVNNKGQIKDQQKFNDALFAIMKERYNNGMVIQSKTFSGMKSTIVGVWQTALAQVAGISKEGAIVQGSFFDTLTKKGNALANVLIKMANDGTFMKISQGLAKSMQAVDKLFTSISLLINFIKIHGDETIAILSGIAAASFVANINNIAWAVLGMAINFGIFTKAVWANTIALLSNPLTGWVVAIGALIGVIIYLVLNWDKVKQKVIEVWNVVVAKLQEAWVKIQPILAKIANGIKTAFNFTPVGILYNTAKTIAGKVQQHEANKPKGKIAKNALGSSSFKGGPTWVGEKGPEIVDDIPKGASIYSNKRSKALLGGGGNGIAVYITIEGNADENTMLESANKAYKEFERKVAAFSARQKRLGYT